MTGLALGGHRLDRIGQGFCGTVWAETPSRTGQLCIKREDGGPGRSIRNEYQIQAMLTSKLAGNPRYAVGFSVPASPSLLEEANPLWEHLLPGFPPDYEACNAMVSERIQPLCAGGREELVRRYCPGDIQDRILADGKNEACLARLYLGRRRKQTQSGARRRFFSLRNYPLHADQVEELGLPSAEYARAMARALAFLNWGAGIDGNDVEFVLAAPRTGAGNPGWDSGSLGRHGLWMLDFDCCRGITMDEKGVEQIVRAFWRNDPYYPRPGGGADGDERLWEVFAAEYRRASVEIIHGEAQGQKDVVGHQGALVDRVLARIPETRNTFAKG